MIAMSAHIRNKDVLRCLPLLASVLGDQYGVEVRIGGDTAATNGRIIRLPSLSLEADEIVLALARGYIDHESAHIRYTNHAAVHAARMDTVTRHLWNSIEDWRIENRLAEVFPGCRQNLHWLMRRLFLGKRKKDVEMAEKKFPAISVLHYVLYTVRAWDVPDINKPRQVERKKLDALFPGMAVQLDAILDRVRRHCPDTEAVIDYARELAECIRKWIPQNPERQSAPPPEDRNSNHTKDKGTQPEDDALQRGDESQGQSHRESSPSQTKDEQAEGSDYAASQSQQATAQGLAATASQDALHDLFRLDASKLPPSVGDVLAGELQANAANDVHTQLVVARAVERKRSSLTDEDKRKAIRASTALRTRLQGLLQAQTLRQCQMGRRGRLHTSSLYRLSVGNPRVFLRESERHGLDTAVHILLDGSGSMRGEPMRLASLSCYAVARSLEMIPGVSVGATLFPATMSSSDVCPLVRHGEMVSDRFGISATGETPLAEALWWVMQTMLRLKEARKILLILTDGMPQRMYAVRHALGSVPKLGIEAYGIGINNPDIANLLPYNSRVITSMDDLAPTMFDILQKSLTGGMNVGRN